VFTWWSLLTGKLCALCQKKKNSKRGNAMEARDDKAFYQLAKRKGSIFFDDKAQEEVRASARYPWLRCRFCLFYFTYIP
jgi:hypothetical protein